MPSFYKDKLAPRLAQRLEEYLGSSSRQEQLRLYEEIAVARVMACEAMELHAALMLGRENGETRIEVGHVLAASEAVNSALQRVAELCTRCAAVEKSLADKVGVEQLGFFVEEIVRVVHRRLGESEQARLLVEDLRNRVRVPGEGVDPRSEVEVVVEFGDAA